MINAFGAVATAPWRVEYLPVEVPEPGPEDVVIRVTHSWISNGTEGSFVRGERIAGDTPRRETDPMPFPHIPGYQKVGIVESVGAEVTRIKPGDSVFATVSRVNGMFYDFGGHVSPAVTHQSQVMLLDQELDPISASGLVLTQVGYNVGACAEPTPGDRAVVIGDGMVGHWAAQTFQLHGTPVLMLGRHDYRLDFFGVGEDDGIVNTNTEDAVEAVKQWAPNGVNIIADTVGSITTLESLYKCARRFTNLVSAGFYGVNGKIDIQTMRNYEMTLHAPSGWTPNRMGVTLDLLMDGTLTTSHLITHRFPISQVQKAFDLILSKKEPVLGVILDWQAGDKP
jgi:2-desacetyl-2-hydroxyethyl bacteriochlorophyllide A dehydrogenase